jgi:hypothetical protein
MGVRMRVRRAAALAGAGAGGDLAADKGDTGRGMRMFANPHVFSPL